MVFHELQQEGRIPLLLLLGIQGASRVASGKSSLHSSFQGE